MRRRICAALLAGALLLCRASAAVLTLPGVLTLKYPDDWENLGADDAQGEVRNLGFLAGPKDTDLNLSIDLSHFPEYEQLRLFEADEQTLRDYAAWLLEDYENGSLVEIRRVSAYGIPFVVLRLEDFYGPSYVAETLSNGWDLALTAYAFADENYDYTRELSDRDMETFRALIDSIEPLLN